MTTLKINGTEIVNYISVDSFDWQRNDLEGPGAGRTLSGLAYRDLVATKIRLDLSCRELSSSERTALETLLFSSEFLTVTSDDAVFRNSSRTMYCTSMQGSFSRRNQGGAEYWKNVKFALVER